VPRDKRSGRPVEHPGASPDGSARPAPRTADHSAQRVDRSHVDRSTNDALIPVIKLRALWQILISAFSQSQLSVPLVAGLILAYAGELGQPTFHTDKFFEISYRNNLLDYWTSYGRYLSKLIMLALDNLYPPTFLLLVGLIVLACVGVILAELWGVTGWARSVFILILCTFPFFLESFSFYPLRYAMPLAIGFAVLAVVRGGIIGLACAFCALLMYQGALYFAAVVVLVWAAIEALKGRPWLTCMKAIVAPKLGLIILGLVIDAAALLIMNSFISRIGLLDYNKLVSSFDQLQRSLALNLRAMASFFWQPGVFLFPLWTKLIAVAGLLAIVVGLLRASLPAGNRAFVLVMLGALPFAAHGTNLCLASPNQFLFERVLISYAAVYIGIFAIALAASATSRLKSAIAIIFAFAALGFVYQTNLWHEYLQLKNMADMDMARAIADRLKADAAYQPGLPLVILGASTPADYLPYRTFHPKEGLIQDTDINSAFTFDWSKDRILIFFVPFASPGPQQVATATRNAQGHAAWPAPDSVFVKDGVMTVVLQRTDTTQGLLMPGRTRGSASGTSTEKSTSNPALGDLGLLNAQQRPQSMCAFRVAQTSQRLRLDLPDPFAAQVELLGNLLQRMLAIVTDPESQPENRFFVRV